MLHQHPILVVTYLPISYPALTKPLCYLFHSVIVSQKILRWTWSIMNSRHMNVGPCNFFMEDPHSCVLGPCRPSPVKSFPCVSMPLFPFSNIVSLVNYTGPCNNYVPFHKVLFLFYLGNILPWTLRANFTRGIGI